MKRGRKKKIIIPESVAQHVEEEFKKNLEFRKAYSEEVTRLRIAYKVVLLRKERHLSQAELARRMGTTQQTISRLEDPQNKEITVATLSKVALALRARLSVDFIPQKA